MSLDAAAADRLPWLADEPPLQPHKRRRSSLFAWVAALGALAATAAGGLWMSSNSLRPLGSAPLRLPRTSTTLVLPPSRPAAQGEVPIVPQPEVRLPPAPEVRPSPVREVHVAAPRSEPLPPRAQQSPPRAKGTGAFERQFVPAPPAPVPSPATSAPRPGNELALPLPWNPRQVNGASGRIVQVGAFGSVRQAKRGWWFMVHEYPAMAHLPAVVRQTRNSKNRAFYRFDIGTTSQAHSEVLCQRMTRVGLSCAVIGLPWKAKVER